MSTAILCILGAAFCMADGEGLADNPYAASIDTSCGSMCVAFMDRYYGGDRSYEQISKICQPSAVGVNLMQIQEALQGLGYSCRGVQFVAGDVAPVQLPAVLHVSQLGGRDHFVVAVSRDSNSGDVRIFDPPLSLRWMTAAEAKVAFTGIALEVSDKPFTMAAEPQVNRLGDIALSLVTILMCVACIKYAMSRPKYSTSKDARG